MASKLFITLLLLIVISKFASPMTFKEQIRLNRIGGRSLADKPREAMTCDKHPAVCRSKESAGGPNCCNKNCVDLKTDKLNCGKCGKRCNYSEMCCQGQCVNPSADEKNCGKCNDRCGKGSSCVYGLCSYA